MSSEAPRGVSLSNIPTPSRTSSHSIRKYASASGTTRTDQPGPFGGEPSLRRSEEHTSELQSHSDLVCRLLLEKKKGKCSNNLYHYHPQNQPFQLLHVIL